MAEPIDTILKLYPMPANNELWVHNVPLGAHIKMLSMNGVESINVVQDQDSLEKRIDTSGLNAGVYVVRTFNINNEPISMRVIVAH
jgi:Secretion system C-terminal sorting domain